MKVYWDIDGTILLNPLPSPNWEDPAARHPTTGEPISGQMPIYNSRAHLNPELTLDDLKQIKYVITSRPEFRRETTLRQLRQHGIYPDDLIMYPGSQIYSRDRAAEYKAIQLDLYGATHYVDNDPDFGGLVQELLSQKWVDCTCVCIEDWRDILRNPKE